MSNQLVMTPPFHRPGGTPSPLEILAEIVYWKIMLQFYAPQYRVIFSNLTEFYDLKTVEWGYQSPSSLSPSFFYPHWLKKSYKVYEKGGVQW